MKMLHARPSAQQMMERVSGVLDEKAGEFVEKLWQGMIFEEMKIQEGMYK
jgi:hypothetical protein